MGMRIAVLATVLLLPNGMPGQQAPTVEQMKQMLDVSQRRGQLEMEGGTPFHLVACYESYDSVGKGGSRGKIDEIWVDPHRYRQTFTVPAIEKGQSDDSYLENVSLPPRQLVEVDNGTRAWRTGEWVVFGSRGCLAVLKPFYLLSTTTNRLSYELLPNDRAGLDCIGVEPDLPGVPRTHGWQ